MPWMLPAVIAALLSTFVLASVYFYLYTQDRQKFLLVWAAGWSVYVLRFGFMLLTIISGQTVSLKLGYHLTALISGTMLLWGTYLFLGKRLPHAWVYSSVIIGIVVAAAISFDAPFLVFTLPNFFFLAVIYIWTGTAFILHRSYEGIGSRIVGWAFILWGIHKADYPFLRSEAWFAPWGYIISTVIELTIILGMLLVYFQKMKKELVDKEARFRLFAENAQDVIYRYRLVPAPAFDYVSPSVTVLTGYTPEEHYSDPDLGFRIVHPDDRGLLQDAMRAPDSRPLIVRWKHRDGSLLWTEQRNVPVYDEKGVIVAIEGIARDITERKKAEDAHKELALERDRLLNQLRLQFDRMPIGLVLFDADLAILDWNPAAEKIFGFTKEDVIGKDIRGLIVPESEIPFLKEFLKDLKKGEKTMYAVNKNLTKDGRTVLCEWHDTPLFDESGDLIGVMGMVQDITDRKRAEEALRDYEKRFREFLENMHLCAVMLDRGGNVTFCNDYLLNLTGWTRDEVIGRSWFDVFIPADLRNEIKAYFSGLLSGSGSLHHENPILTRTGDQRYIVWDNTLLRDSGKSIVATASIGIDVTEHRKVEEQLRQAQKMEAVGQLAGGIAHDFNNILSAIVGYAYLLKMKMTEDSPLLLLVEHILESAERAATLTHSLLAFSRKQAISIKPVDLNEVIRKMEKFLLRIIGEDIEMKTKLAEEALVVMADAGQMEQVLMNLATNARDAMPEGGILAIHSGRNRIDETFIAAHGYGEPGTYALITVSDTGLGMDERTKGKIFDPFFTTKEVGRGTGLGLAIVYGIVKQHNGFINVSSEPGKGTTFMINLPLAAQGEEADLRTGEGAEAIPHGTETLLIAEDDEALRKLTSSVLREFGYTVVEAVDGEEAVRKFAERDGDIRLLILDMIMPKKNGKEAYDEIRGIKPSVRALFVSGYTADIVRDKGMLGGDAEILLKPISPMTLLKKVRELLDKDEKKDR